MRISENWEIRNLKTGNNLNKIAIEYQRRPTERLDIFAEIDVIGKHDAQHTVTSVLFNLCDNGVEQAIGFILHHAQGDHTSKRVVAQD